MKRVMAEVPLLSPSLPLSIASLKQSISLNFARSVPARLIQSQPCYTRGQRHILSNTDASAARGSVSCFLRWMLGKPRALGGAWHSA